MQHMEGSGTPVLYIGRTVLKGWNILRNPFRLRGMLQGQQFVYYNLLKDANAPSALLMYNDNHTNQSL
jgi:hypothetical protein